MRLQGNKRRISLLLAVAVMALSACSLANGSYGSEARSGQGILQDLAVSPDGQLVAFQYCPENPKRCGVGIWNANTGNFDLISNPPGGQLGYPSFSQDGKRMAVVASCIDRCSANESERTQIIILDTATRVGTQVTSGLGYRMVPVFQPDSQNILFVSHQNLKAVKQQDGRQVRAAYGLHLLNLADNSETVVLQEGEGFDYAIQRPSFIGANEVIFSAMSPVRSDLREAVIRLGKSGGWLASIAYRLRFQSPPEFLPENGGPASVGIPSISGLSASRYGPRLVFIDLSSVEPKQKNGWFNVEIFKSEGGKIEQVTNLKTHMAASRLSDDGRVVAFLADDTRRGNFDLFILDIETRQVKATDLRDRLIAQVSRPGFKM